MESLFLVFWRRRSEVDTAPAVDISTPHRTEYPVLEAFVLALHFLQKFLGTLTIGVTVSRTYRLHNGKLIPQCGAANGFFGCKYKGTDKGYLLA